MNRKLIVGVLIMVFLLGISIVNADDTKATIERTINEERQFTNFDITPSAE